MACDDMSSAFYDQLNDFQRTLGLRFLFPVYYIPEVEITPNKYTSGGTIEKGKVRFVLGTNACGKWKQPGL